MKAQSFPNHHISVFFTMIPPLIWTNMIWTSLTLFFSYYYQYFEQSVEFFVFASLMAFDMLIFAVMAYRYTYVKHEAEYDPVDFDNTGLVGEVREPSLTNTDDRKPGEKDESNI